MPIHRITHEHELLIVNNPTHTFSSLRNTQADIAAFWAQAHQYETMFVINIRTLRQMIANRGDREIGVLIHRESENSTIILGGWGFSDDSCNHAFSRNHFYVLPLNIATHWSSNDGDAPDESCIAARIAIHNGQLYVFFHRGTLTLSPGGDTGGDNLNLGVRVPTP